MLCVSVIQWDDKQDEDRGYTDECCGPNGLNPQGQTCVPLFAVDTVRWLVVAVMLRRLVGFTGIFGMWRRITVTVPVTVMVMMMVTVGIVSVTMLARDGR